MLKSKKAQLGETMTWVIATIIIIGILIIFTFISSLFATENGMVVNLKKTINQDDLTNVDLVKEKTNLALDINGNDYDKINNWIKEIKDE